MLPLSLVWKLGLHPSTLVCMNCSSSNLPKWVPMGPMDSHEGASLYIMVIICYLCVSWRD
jgi:hypothetical protein